MQIDAGTRREHRGRLVLGGDPARLLRLTARGAALLDHIELGAPPPESGPGVDALIGRLLDAGVLHPPRPLPAPPDTVTVVVPVRDRAEGLQRLLTSLRRGFPGAVLVVDDGSIDAAGVTAVARAAGARLLRREVSGGPAAARNQGIAAVTTPWVVCLDSDLVLEDGHVVLELAGWLTCDGVVAAAPRVVGGPGEAEGSVVVSRWEQRRSPLDLGDRAGWVGPGRRVGFVPAAAIAISVEAWRRVGGFDASLPVGEDVDLVWRLIDGGGRVRYDPDLRVAHTPRSTIRAAWAQRVGYGRSAALLDRRHPGRVAPVVVSPWSLAVWIPALCVRGRISAVLAGGLIVAATSIPVMRHLPEGPQRHRFALRIALRGHVQGGRAVARALVRPWWPATCALMVVLRRRCPVPARRLGIAAAAGVVVEAGSLVAVPAVAADDLAYSVGVWSGALRARSSAALRPRFLTRSSPQGGIGRGEDLGQGRV